MDCRKCGACGEPVLLARHAKTAKRIELNPGLVTLYVPTERQSDEVRPVQGYLLHAPTCQAAKVSA